MEIPMLTNFIEGLKLFFESKRTRWFTLIFVIGAVTITIWESLGAIFEILEPLVFTGGVFPIYFMLTAFMSLLGLSRFVASDESYMTSFLYTLVWGVISVLVLIGMVIFTFGLFILVFVGVAFLGWIVFQSYFATRTSLGFAESVDMGERSLLVGLLYGVIYIFNYLVIIGSLIFGVFFLPQTSWIPPVWAFFGALLALGFNFLIGLILLAERNKSTASGVSVLGLFISLYSAYFIYNVLKGFDPNLDLVSIAISVAFILYTMSGIGRTLASRSDVDTRFKLSKEFAATLTYFMASGFMFVDSVFTAIIVNEAMQGIVSDVIKLFLFPFIALIMVLRYLYISRKAVKDAVPISEEQPVIDEDEPMLSEDEPAVIDEPVEEEDVLLVPEEEYTKEPSEDSDEPQPKEEEFNEDE
ncbi:MAG: hypothetical protein ACW97G_09320 [Candidatus Thorarchaeota archaeon]